MAATKTSEASRQGHQYETPSQGARPAINGAIIFNSADDMFAAMFGPSQHDAHVAARRRELKFAALEALGKAQDKALSDYVQVLIASERARRPQ